MRLVERRARASATRPRGCARRPAIGHPAVQLHACPPDHRAPRRSVRCARAGSARSAWRTESRGQPAGTRRRRAPAPPHHVGRAGAGSTSPEPARAADQPADEPGAASDRCDQPEQLRPAQYAPLHPRCSSCKNWL